MSRSFITLFVSQQQILKEAYKSFTPLQKMHHPDTKCYNTKNRWVSVLYFKDKEVKKKTWGDQCKATESWCQGQGWLPFLPLKPAFRSVKDILLLPTAHVVFFLCFLGSPETAEHIEYSTFETPFATIMLKIPAADEPLPLSCMTDNTNLCTSKRPERCIL